MAKTDSFLTDVEEEEKQPGKPNDAGAYVPQQYNRAPEEPPLLAKIGRGFMDVGEGAKQLWMEATDDNDLDRWQADVNEERDSYAHDAGEGFDGGRMVGNVAPFLATAPLAVSSGASYLGAAAVGAVEGGVAGLLEYTRDDDSRVGNVLTGLLSGLLGSQVFKGAADLAAPVYRGAKGLLQDVTGSKAAQIANETGIPVSQSPIAKEQASKGLTPDAGAVERQARIESQGFTGDAAPTPAQISRDPKVWQAQSEAQKETTEQANKLTQRIMNQDSRFKGIFNELRENTGRNADEVLDAGESINVAVNTRFKETQKAVGKLYQAAKNEFGDVDGVNLDGVKGLSDEIGDDTSLSAITDSVSKRMQKLGLIDADGEPTGKTLTITQAEGFRKFVSRLGGGGGAKPSEIKRVKDKLINSIDDATFDTIGDDAYREARSAAAGRFKEFEKRIVDRIIKGKANGDDVIKDIVLKHNSSEIAELRETLLNATGGEQALSALKAEVIDALEMAARAGKPDHSAFSGAAYDRMLQRIGKKKIAALFGDEANELYRIRDTGLDMTFAPPFSNVNNANTSSSVINAMRRGALGAPMLGDAVKGYSRHKAAKDALQGSNVPKSVIRDENKRLSESIRQNPYYRTGVGLLHPSIMAEKQATDWWNEQQ